jgi:hypothetical protein
MREFGGNILFSATDLMRFMGCPHATHLDLLRMQGEGPEPGEDTEDAALLQKQGDAHQATHLEKLKSSGRRVIEIDRGDLARNSDETRDALATGADVVFQGAFLSGNWGGWSTGGWMSGQGRKSLTLDGPRIASSLREPAPLEVSNDALCVHRKVRCGACFGIQAFVFVIRNASKNEAEGNEPFLLKNQPCDHDLGVVANAQLEAADRQGKGRGREAKINVPGTGDFWNRCAIQYPCVIRRPTHENTGLRADADAPCRSIAAGTNTVTQNSPMLVRRRAINQVPALSVCKTAGVISRSVLPDP